MPTDYSGPNRLADPAYQQQILQATTDRKRYGNLLFDAIIHNDPGPGGQVELTTEKGFDLALTRTNRALRIELELDRNNLAIHEYRWEFLRRGERTPVALLEHAPLYRRLAGTNQPLLVPGDSQLKVLVAICNPSTKSRAKYSVIETLPALDVRLETEIATLALQRLKAAQLLTYDILPKHPEEVVTRMLLDRSSRAAITSCIWSAMACSWATIHLGTITWRSRARKISCRFLRPATLVNGLASTRRRTSSASSCWQPARARSAAPAMPCAAWARLVLEGQVPAVIAMQEKLPFDTAQLFTQSFYDDLARAVASHGPGRHASNHLQPRRRRRRHLGHPRPLPERSGWQDLRHRQAESREPGPSRPGHPHLSPVGRQRGPALAALNQTLAAEAQAIGATNLAGALQRTVRSALSGPSTAGHAANRDLLTNRLKLGARVDAADLSAFVVAETGMVIAADAYSQIAAALNKGKHIILIGPPGTGKTTLAQAICRYATDERGACAPAPRWLPPPPTGHLRYRGRLCAHHGADAGVPPRQLLAGHPTASGW